MMTRKADKKNIDIRFLTEHNGSLKSTTTTV